MGKGGRPLKFQNAEELQEQIDYFFSYCEENDKLPTITRLAVFLDTSRETLINYEEKEEFFDTIARAKRRVQMTMEDMLYNKQSARGAEFTLKNNFGWKDEKNLDHTSKGEHIDGVQIVYPGEEDEASD